MLKYVSHSLKYILPHSLFGRFLLIMIIPTVLVQLVATYMFYQRHWNNVSSHMMIALANEIAMITQMREHQTIAERHRVHIMANDYLSLKTAFKKNVQLPPMQGKLSSELNELRIELTKRVFSQVNVSYINGKQDVEIRVQMPGGVLEFIASRKRFYNPSTYIFILWMTGTASILLIIAILFSRIQIRAISRLAIAAEQFGKGQELQGFKPEGANEVRKAALAFLKMKERIERQISQRTEMLAGVSHDLRTPLTRMKLQLAMLGDSPYIRDLETDILDMEKMIQGYLDFARGEGTETAQAVCITELIEKIVASYNHYDNSLQLTISTPVTMPLRQQAIRRAITNILDNAVRYARNIAIDVRTTPQHLIVTIDDDGEGIPEEMREIVFKPFYRIDSSRNLETGGVGLGLAIARDIINGHGGTITLGESPAKGLRVVIRLPL
jgi:two-component system, OmpR family, osmolarity sensor histidine kinase EnvZ